MKLTRRELKRLITEALKGKNQGWEYEIVSGQNLPDNPSTPDDVKDVLVKIVSGDSGVGYKFKLSAIQTRSGREAFLNHPLVAQVIDEINKNSTQKDVVVKTPAKKNENDKFLFVGDSQTYYPGVSYADLILKEYPGKKVAKNGANLQWMSNALEKELSVNNDYSVITIMGGGNNSYSKFPPYQLYDEMYDLAKSIGAIVVAITNPTKSNLPSERLENLPSNEKLAEYVRVNSKPDVIIDANSLFTDRADFVADRVHLNKASHIKLKNEWIENVLDVKKDVWLGDLGNYDSIV